MTHQMAILFTARGANDAISGLMEDYGTALTENGCNVIYVAANEPAEIQYAVDLMAKGTIGFTMTWLGIGQDLLGRTGDGNASVNVFEAAHVPLIKLQGDLPAYFPQRHGDTPRTTANLYQAEEFIAFRERFLPEARTPSAMLPPIPMAPMELAEVDYAAKQSGTLVFLKNGNSPEKLRGMWAAALPSRLSEIAIQMADAITYPGLRPGRLDIGAFVADFLRSSTKILQAPTEWICFFAAQMDDYLRRVKSALIAESILDFPVIVQGSFWDHVDFSGRRATLASGRAVDLSSSELKRQLGTIDMSANTDTWPHDRVQRAAGSYSLALTNRQTWLNSGTFEQFEDMTFEFDRESIQHRVADALSNPKRYLDLAVSFGEAFRETYSREQFARRALEMADLVNVLWATPRPKLQPYFSWQ